MLLSCFHAYAKRAQRVCAQQAGDSLIEHHAHGTLSCVMNTLTQLQLVPLTCFCLVCSQQAGGALIGPHALGIIQDVEGVRHLAELGVVFLLFNIGLELSLERLRSMQKYVFGMGTAQVCRLTLPLLLLMLFVLLLMMLT